MLLPRLISGLRTTCSSVLRQQPFLKPAVTTTVRYATHKASKASNGAKDGPGKRLGAKKTTGEKVVTGMIIYRQRGTIWHPGENAGIGRDHTIYALQPGYVRYYKDPAKHPRRQYIGIAVTPTQTLPKPQNAARVRRLGMVAVPLHETVKKSDLVPQGTPMTREDNWKVSQGSYIPRAANWRIGKVMPKLVRKKVRADTRRKAVRKREIAVKKRK
ncbi:ribosomal protein L27 [Morchella conica CCBAS932]|uniref:Large ribosomal subunit protein bL27m n=1 Tax=Morchella conica CCBAS932 TaxID=1392247 RepID=A0A3N4KGI8_9PEZI|nr:ribosomal protein L27 [Morchella conica CCBAS932]